MNVETKKIVIFRIDPTRLVTANCVRVPVFLIKVIQNQFFIDCCVFTKNIDEKEGKKFIKKFKWYITV